MKALITQSFEIFNLYGKQPEAITSIVQGFAMILENHEIRDIQAAFKAWMRESSTMPTPADIVAICDGEARHRAEMQQYRRPPAQPEKPKEPVKYWADLDEAGRAAVVEEIMAMAPDMRGYLIRSWRVPDGVIE